MKLNQAGGARTDIIVKFILVFFISLLSFSVGTFVGKQFSDSQHRLAALETDYEKSESQIRETASIPAGQTNVEPDKALTEEDISKMAEDFVAQDDVKKEEPKTEKNDGGKVDKAAAIDIKDKKTVIKAPKIETTIEKAADKVAQGKAPLAPQPIEKPAAKPTMPRTVASSTVGKFTVQISAQPSEDLAKQQAEKLKGQGYSAFYVESPKTKDGKTWYRVNVGLFQTAKDASDYSKTITGKFSGAFVKPIIQ